ncbi:hypothetical protein F5B22DRAFT_649112 [Xylaria bambusicola]|uniref:uncharacterized protein n=1 Tax=Xylaria bambusicola TaxID=326684 RepID=UPI0020074FEC|nr:uncharacterized protein F5B22DRAFT_649112 [Xylaria bambusicola]KAI0509273.1 hypothetical protein F5B22DRAFT_649112 [Xylaria bambusicola]
MEANTQEKPQGGRASWGQYAHCTKMIQFGNIGSPSNNQGSFADKNKQNGATLPVLISPKAHQVPRQPIWSGNDCPGVIAKFPEKHPSRFGVPSPPRNISGTPLWVQMDVEMVKITQHGQRSLESLYKENPDRKLQGHINSSTLHFAAEVVLQLVDEAACRWLNKWCPHMDLYEVLADIGIKGPENSHAYKRYNVPLDAMDLSIVNGSLVETYQQCRGIISKDSDEIQFPKLIELIDQSAVFLRAIKDTKGVVLLLTAKSTFQWIPICLDAKKLSVLGNSNMELDKLNQKYRDCTTNDEIKSEALRQQRQADELNILDKATAEFISHCETFEIEMLNGLCGLLAWRGD